MEEGFLQFAKQHGLYLKNAAFFHHPPFYISRTSVTVKTRAPQNELVTVWYRIPKNYHPRQGQMSRVLVLFGGRNSSGKNMASGGLEWGKWADENNAFLVSPGFKDDNYWEPEKWSGRALLNALEQIRKRYNICTDKLLFYGYSAGSQCSNLFPAWRPQLTRAWVSHACGVFHEPTAQMRFVAGLVTCGDADHARYVISRNFVENCREKGDQHHLALFPQSSARCPAGFTAACA